MSTVKRELDIDAARGLMLAWMTLTHLPTALTPWVNQPLGYLSASEGFIFLSALFTGRIYYRLMTRDGLPKMTAELLLRALRLYGYHVLLLLFAFGIAARYALGSHGQGLYNLLDFYFAAGHARAIRDALLLVYRPPLLDIVPLYIIFLLLSPIVILAARRIGWKYMLSAAFALWALAQFGLREACYAYLAHHFGLQTPLNEMGAVQPVGLAVGVGCGDVVRSEVGQRGFAGGEVGAANVDTGCGFGRGVFDLALPANLWIGPNHLCVFRGQVASGDSAAHRLFGASDGAGAFPVSGSGICDPAAGAAGASVAASVLHAFHILFIGIGMMGDAERIFGWKQAALIVVTFAALLAVAKFAAKPKAVGGQAGATRKERRPVTAAVAQR